MEEKKYFVHPSSYIDDNVTIGSWVCECGRRLDETMKCTCGREYVSDGDNITKKH